MGLFDGCLLASDYDGTLADSQGNIPDRVRSALRYFISEGGLFTVCTGRSVQGFHAFDAAIMNAPVLCANGAVLYDFKENRQLLSCTVSEAVIPMLTRIKRNFPFVCVEMYNNDRETFVCDPDTRTHLHLSRQGIGYRVVSDFREVRFPLVKIMLGVGAEHSAQIQSWFDTVDMGEIKYIPNTGEYIELLHTSSDKGRGLQSLASVYGIRPDRIFSVGDGANDADMLRTAAIGFVPANGDALAVQAGDVTVCSNDEGAVADAVFYIENLIRSESEEKTV